MDEPSGPDATITPAVASGEAFAVLQGIVHRLTRMADDRVGRRQMIELRWIRDTEQYLGEYDSDTMKGLSGDDAKSSLFINLTRPKTNALSARLSDMLFPTDDRNWGIGPTPVPMLTEQTRALTLQMAAAVEQLQKANEQEKPQAVAEVERRKQALAQAKAISDEAASRGERMQQEMEDQLNECRYHIACREVIEDACRLGTGVLKGPCVGNRMAKRWQKGADGNYQLADAADNRPHFLRVDPWGFFPDPSARSMEDSEGEFERHLMTQADLRKLAKRPGFDKDAIRRLLKGPPQRVTPQYLADLRRITGDQTDTDMNRFQVWEYHGLIEPEEYLALALATGQPGLLDANGEIDPLEIPVATVWFCENELLAFAAHPFDSGESIYSVFNLERDAASVFGFGIPAIMADPQRALNAGWRMMLDNSGLTAGPQIVVNSELIEPADGDWTIKPMKVWRAKALPPGAPADHAFKVYNIDSHQAELANIIALSRQFVDEETAIPMLAQGDQGQNVTKTLGGMSILMNSANVVLRRIVKNWDDDMTVPNIRRLYHWNMQFSPREDIKGDMEVDARGTSVLLVRELQAQNLMNMVALFTANPLLTAIAKVPAMARALIKAQQLNPDELLLTDDEIAQAAAAAQAKGEQKDPEIIRLEAQLNIAEIDAESRREVAMIQRETAMIKLAAEGNMSMEELRLKLEAEDRRFAAEAALSPIQGTEGALGSGGSLSVVKPPVTPQPAAGAA